MSGTSQKQERAGHGAVTGLAKGSGAQYLLVVKEKDVSTNGLPS